jgi:pimeloyl-ACP methyl ester carboxylesterase
LRGDSDALRQEWDDVIAWATEATGDEDGEIDPILAETLEAAGPHGVDGFVDDHLSVVRNWGFTVEAIRVPVRIMLAREDTSVPAAHGEWLASHLREGELLWVDGDHFGPRNDSEMRLIEWVALG